MTLQSRTALIGLTTLTLLLMAPLAAAMSLPIVGDIDPGLNWPFGLFLVAVIAIAASFFGLVRSNVNKLPGGRLISSGGVALGVVLLLVVSFLAPGGWLNADGAEATTGAPAASVGALGATYDANLYEPVSKVTFYAADAALPSTAVNPVLSIYKPGVTDKAAMEGTGVPLYSGTLSSGTLTLDGIQVQQYGCTFDIGVDAANYYEKVVRNANLCRQKNPNGLNTVSVPTIFMDKIGTNSLSLTATSLTCSAGSTCTYSLVVRNSVVDTKIASVAAKFEAVGTTVSGATVYNATLESVVTGSACELVEVSGTKYIKFMNDLGSLESRTCNVQVSRASGSADGQFKWTMDDLFQANGATAFNTNSNTRGAAATSATTVSFT